MFLERPDIDLHLSPEVLYAAEDTQGVDEELHVRLKVRIDEVLPELVCEVVTVGVDLVEPVGLVRGDGVSVNKS
jgi:hypothetical protein